MPSEKVLLQSYCHNKLNEYGIDFLHLHPLSKKYQKKYFPDTIFAWNEKVYMFEFGIKGRHTDRKKKQLELMRDWQSRAQNSLEIAMFFDRNDLIEYLDRMGLK